MTSQLANNANLSQTNLSLSAAVKKAKKLNIERFEAFGVIQRRSAKLVLTTRASRVDNLWICYTVPLNPLTEPGEKRYYIQVIDPSLNVIGSNTPIQFEGQVLKYSYVNTFSYENQTLDICDFSVVEESDFEKGVYTVNIFDKSELV